MLTNLCGRSQVDLQTVFVFRTLFQRSGGGQDSVQQMHNELCTISQNAALCAYYFGIPEARKVGTAT